MVVATLATTMALAQQPFDLDPGFQTAIMTAQLGDFVLQQVKR